MTARTVQNPYTGAETPIDDACVALELAQEEGERAAIEAWEDAIADARRAVADARTTKRLWIDTVCGFLLWVGVFGLLWFASVVASDFGGAR